MTCIINTMSCEYVILLRGETMISFGMLSRMRDVKTKN